MITSENAGLWLKVKHGSVRDATAISNPYLQLLAARGGPLAFVGAWFVGSDANATGLSEVVAMFEAAALGDAIRCDGKPVSVVRKDYQ